MPPCERCAQQPGRYCRACERWQHATMLYAIMQEAVIGQRPGADAPHLSFALLPEDTKHGWLLVADAAAEMRR